MLGKLTGSTAVRVLLATLTCLLCIVSSSLLPGATAHNLGQSYIYLQIREDAISARVEMPVKELSEVLELDLPVEQKVRRDDIEPYIEQIRAYVDEHLTLSCAPQACSPVFQEYGFLNTTFSQFLTLEYNLNGFQAMPEAIDVTYDVILEQLPQHTNMLLVEENWMTGTFQNESTPLMIFRQPGQTQTLDLTSGSLWQGFSAIVYLGIIHIVEGIDHVFFLGALLLPSVLSRQEDSIWQPVDKFSTAFIYIVKIATAFTIAHSVTLCLATLQIVQVPSRIVESIIAASIGLAAVDIFYPIFRGRSWLIIFLFGLFHGFGFADVLADLGVTSQNAALSLFGFNLGVEIGQLIIIAVIFPVLYLLRNQWFYPSFVMRTGALSLGAMSLYWFIERAFDVNIRVLPILQGLF
ncbi:membrane protein [Leptolyngbya sp. Heron Island J]|uniref:HupE/UreJ family protein n=1 Tax=Leptolyngbya sp. Heron Island J TaxID=1385935 RepID=UPI0003B95439|nr:HupE/UreJ family protein [Leptolyngbya sp. Heron Island J]ESA38536.1 membrane protein [Leptolyngbya sp. Heron Island J]